MKHLSFLLLTVLVFVFRSGGQVISDCTPSPALKKAYRADVADMALQRIYELKSPDTILIEIPQRYQDTIMGALAAVCNLDTVYEADSVFMHYCVHRYRNYMQRIRVKLDPDISWIANWRAHNINTGDLKLDSFIHRYGVYIGQYSLNPGSAETLRDWAYLFTDHHINWKAFGDSLMLFPGFWGYSKEYQIGDGDRIYFSKDSLMHLTFIAGRGDCPAGCTEFKSWTYSITKECSVKLDAIDYHLTHHAYMRNCNLAPLAIGPNTLRPKTSVELFPNPVQTTLYFGNSVNGSTRYCIYNVVGKKMLEGNYQITGINVATLPNGFYVFVLQDSSRHGSTVRNFIKQ